MLTWAQRKISEKYHNTMRWAAERGLPFTLSEQDIGTFWQKPCAYCTWAIPTVGLDRVNNAQGYVIENIVAACPVCNNSKMVMGGREYINHCRVVAEAHPGEIDWAMEEQSHRDFYRIKMQAYDRVTNVRQKQPEMGK